MRKEEKAQVVEELKRKLQEYPTVAAVDFTGVPADLVQKLRHEARGEVEIRVAKRTLIERALKEVGRPGLDSLMPHLRGQPALIFSRLSPFRLYRLLEGKKRRAPAKPGSVIPSDIVVRAGEVDLPPGPAVSALQKLGAKARVQAGKVTVLEDFKLLSAGQVVDKEMSDLLVKLDILPVEQALKFSAAWEGGLIYLPEVLRVDEKELLQNLAEFHSRALRLSISVVYPVPQTLPMLLGEAHARALQLALAARFPVGEVLPALLSQAHAHMLALARAVQGKDAVLEESLKALLS
jgi:large subunit ribosomal protein L10